MSSNDVKVNISLVFQFELNLLYDLVAAMYNMSNIFSKKIYLKLVL